MSRSNRRPLATTLLLALPALPACGGILGAPGTLDAAFVPTEVYGHAGVGGNTERAQGFTVENTGEIIQLDLWLKPASETAALDIRILPVDEEGAPLEDDYALATMQLAGGGFLMEEQWVSAKLDVALAVEAGEQLACAVSSPDEDDWNYGLLSALTDENGEAYEGGDTCDRVVGNYEWKSCHDPESAGQDDFGFKVWLTELE